MERVNIIIGRFQPFTLGHLKCAQEAQKKLGVKTVLLVINTVKQDSRHPFLTKQIEKILDKMCKDESSLAGYVLVKNANIVDNIEILREAGYEPISWTCGTDRIDAYNTMVKKYGDDINLDKNFQMIEVKRSDEDISATAVRKALRDDDEEAYMKMVPDIWKKQFAFLREIIMDVKESVGIRPLSDYLTEALKSNVNEARAIEAGNINHHDVDVVAVDLSNKKRKKHGIMIIESGEIDVIAYDDIDEMGKQLQYDLDTYDKIFRDVESQVEFRIHNDHENDRMIMKLW